MGVAHILLLVATWRVPNQASLATISMAHLKRRILLRKRPRSWACRLCRRSTLSTLRRKTTSLLKRRKKGIRGQEALWHEVPQDAARWRGDPRMVCLQVGCRGSAGRVEVEFWS